MPRPPRLQIAGGIYHVTARGNRKQPTFLDPYDHRVHLRCLGSVVARCRWKCEAYCQMTNHFHLLIRTPEANLSAGMQRLNGLYAQTFNQRHDLNGHLFQGRFHSVRVEEDSHLLELVRYILVNPVRAGLCSHPLAWRWSSCRATVGLANKPGFLDVDWLLDLFGADRDEARQRFFRFVTEPLDERA